MTSGSNNCAGDTHFFLILCKIFFAWCFGGGGGGGGGGGWGRHACLGYQNACLIITCVTFVFVISLFTDGGIWYTGILKKMFPLSSS